MVDCCVSETGWASQVMLSEFEHVAMGGFGGFKVVGPHRVWLGGLNHLSIGVLLSWVVDWG